MPNKRVSVAVYGKVLPLAQGDLDSLCGVYACINAVRLMAYPDELDKFALHELFSIALSVLGKERRLKYSLLSGMSIELWQQMQLEVYDAAADFLDLPLRMCPIRIRAGKEDSDDARWQVSQSLRDGVPALCCVAGLHDHFTIIAGETQRHWMLFDSVHLNRFRKSSLEWGIGLEKRHQVDLRSVCFIERLGRP